MTAQSRLNELKKLSLEELMNIEVTLVSKQPEKLAEVAAAIQVITNEDIRRSTATRLPEALRLIPNLQVAQLNSYAWIVSARGFNSFFSNKLLVMIDGRTVYSPLFAGVFWDVQNVLLEDVDRVEAVSGPGGTLWGMNAVNGVINIVTKSAEETQGLYVSGAYGSYLQDFGAIRYGGKIGSRFSYRVFAQRYDHNALFLLDDTKNTDRWGLTQGGFRIDGAPSEKDEVMLQGNVYGGTQHTAPSASSVDGQNVLGRWKHTFSTGSDFVLRLYFDRTWREDIPSTISDQMVTYDFDFQHRFSPGIRHNVLWGVGYRFVRNETQNSTDLVGFIPRRKDMPLYSSFIQDEIALIGDRLKLTLGSKFQHNVYSGFEVQPSARVAFLPDHRHTVWAAVSRAIRTPSRIDVDYYIPAYPVPAGTPRVAGGPDFQSEKVVAYELGYRVQAFRVLSVSLAPFYNQYNDLYSVEALEEDSVAYQIQNGTEGHSTGLEIAAIYRAAPSWKIRGGYNYFQKTLKPKPGHDFDPGDLGNDPTHQFLIQSMLDLPGNFQLDIFCRYVDKLPNIQVPDYFACDARLAWIYQKLELSVAGRNLFSKRHQEFGPVEIPRNVYGKITWRL